MKTALHTVSYCGVWRGQARLPIEEVLSKAAALGYQGVEIVAKRPHASPLDLDGDARAHLRELLRKHKLELACLAGYTDFCMGQDSPGIPALEMQVLYVAELARLAHDLGGSLLRVFTGYERQGIPYETQWELVVRGLQESARRAALWGVTLVVQNHHDIGVHHLAMRDLLAEVGEPNCKAAFDAWAPALQGLAGEELADAVRCMAPYIAYTTVADYARRPRFRYHPTLTNYVREADRVRAVPPGQGFIDYAAFFRALREVGYDGWVAYEMCEVLEGGGSVENLDRTAAHFQAWIREAWERAAG
jgi:sugar phosphate isomerase/epimerase